MQRVQRNTQELVRPYCKINWEYNVKHAKVLAWVNRMRKKHQGKGPLLKLPKGTPYSARMCTLHNCFAPPGKGSVRVGDVAIYGLHVRANMMQSHALPLPGYVIGFIDAFDEGKYPELIKGYSGWRANRDG